MLIQSSATVEDRRQLLPPFFSVFAESLVSSLPIKLIMVRNSCKNYELSRSLTRGQPEAVSFGNKPDTHIYLFEQNLLHAFS